MKTVWLIRGASGRSTTPAPGQQGRFDASLSDLNLTRTSRLTLMDELTGLPIAFGKTAPKKNVDVSSRIASTKRTQVSHDSLSSQTARSPSPRRHSRRQNYRQLLDPRALPLSSRTGGLQFRTTRRKMRTRARRISWTSVREQNFQLHMRPL